MQNSEWWKKAVFYQIYPRSYQDSSGNGIGDLKGIEQRLSYIKDLGVDALWISPFFKSPQKDYGYDVSDYETVDPMFGSNEDFKRLLDKAHAMDLKIIVDLVLSHTSDQHEWFKESISSKDNPKADWYVWADPKADGTAPNNWLSVFGGPAWTYRHQRGQYYLHQFLGEQPDLNFHNPEVQQATLDVIKYWMDFGVDGFRFDAIIHCFSDIKLRDNPAKAEFKASTQFGGVDLYNMQEHKHDRSQKEALDFSRAIRKVLDEKEGVLGLGEIGSSEGIKRTIEYCGEDKLHTAYNFSLLTGTPDDFKASLFKDVINEAKQEKDFWPSWALSNHDMIRVVTRWGGEKHQNNPQFAKLLIAILTTLRGTPFIYEGEELGLTDAKITYEQIQDPWGKFLWPEWQGRDGCRTPMPWEKDKPNAGFSESSTKPWLPIPDDHKERSVDVQLKDEESVLNFVKSFLKWRKTQDALMLGNIDFLATGEDILIYKRDDIICAYNLRAEKNTIPVRLNLTQTEFSDFGTMYNNNEIIFEPFGFGIYKIQ